MQHPLAVVKTRLQHAGAAQTGSVAAFLAARRTLGLRGLYTAFLPVTLAALPAELTYISVVEAGQAALARSSAHPSLVDALGQAGAEGACLALAGAVANVPALALGVPVEVVCARAFTAAAAGDAVAGGAAAAAARQVYAAAGLSGFWRGYGASLATHAPACAVWWGVYAAGRRRLAGPGAAGPNSWAAEGGAGAAAGVASALLTHPLDTVRTRLQSGAEGGGRGWAAAARGLWARGGARAFFAGAGLRAAELGPLSAAGAVVYEAVKRGCALESGG